MKLAETALLVSIIAGMVTIISFMEKRNIIKI